MAHNTVIYRSDYTAPSHKVEQLHLDACLFDDRADITAKMTLRALGDTDSITLQGEGLRLIDVRLDDVTDPGNSLPLPQDTDRRCLLGTGVVGNI